MMRMMMMRRRMMIASQCRFLLYTDEVLVLPGVLLQRPQLFPGRFELIVSTQQPIPYVYVCGLSLMSMSVAYPLCLCL